MEEEFWVDIPGYEGLYEISNLGNIESIRSWKIKIIKTNIVNGYKYIGLYNRSGVQKQIRLNRLLYLCFKGEIPNGYIVEHEDGDNLNNNLSNLRLCTTRENGSLSNIQRKRPKSSSYIGVSFRRLESKFVAQIKVNGKNKFLGSFLCEYDAHLAYQQALSELVNS